MPFFPRTIKKYCVLSALGLAVSMPAASFAQQAEEDGPTVETLTTVQEQPAKTVKQEPENQRSFVGSYLSGRFARGQGDMTRAATYAADALESDPENLDLITHAFRLQLSTGNMQEAIALAHKLAKKPDRDPSVDLLLTVEQVQKKDYAAASKIMDVQEADGFSAIMIPLINAWLDNAQKKTTAPIVMEEVVQGAGVFKPFIYYHLALVNDAAKFNEEAEKDYKLAGTDIAKTPYRVAEAFANFYKRNGQAVKAAQYMEEYRKANPESFLVEGSMAHEMTQSAPKEKAENVIPAALVGTPEEGIAEIFFSVASLLYSGDTPADTMAYTQLALALRPNFPQAQLMLASLYEQSDDAERAMAIYKAIDPKSPLAAKAKLRIALNMDRAGQTAQALKQLDALAAANPKSYDIWLTRGDILRNRERNAEAATAYGEAIKLLGTPEKQHWPIFFVRGIAYERSNQWAKAEADLKKALELEPDQADVLNYLGYSWLTTGKNIEEAKKMIAKAIEQRPADAQIIDSMGWALYLLGDYTNAQEYLERAVELLPGDATVNDHLGDLYWRTDRQTEAKFQWERALNFEKDPKNIAVIRKKLDQGLPALDNANQTAGGKKSGAAKAKP